MSRVVPSVRAVVSPVGVPLLVMACCQMRDAPAVTNWVSPDQTTVKPSGVGARSGLSSSRLPSLEADPSRVGAPDHRSQHALVLIERVRCLGVADFCGWSPENGSDVTAAVCGIGDRRFIELHDEKAGASGSECGMIG